MKRPKGGQWPPFFFLYLSPPQPFTATPATDKGAGKQGKKSKLPCLDFQVHYGGPGCNRGDKCRYRHDVVNDRKAFDELVARRDASRSASEAEKEKAKGSGKGKGGKKHMSPLKQFRWDNCRFGEECRNKDKCKKSHTLTRAQFAAKVKELGATGTSSSESEADAKA